MCWEVYELLTSKMVLTFLWGNHCHVYWCPPSHNALPRGSLSAPQFSSTLAARTKRKEKQSEEERLKQATGFINASCLNYTTANWTNSVKRKQKDSLLKDIITKVYIINNLDADNAFYIQYKLFNQDIGVLTSTSAAPGSLLKHMVMVFLAILKKLVKDTDFPWNKEALNIMSHSLLKASEENKKNTPDVTSYMVFG